MENKDELIEYQQDNKPSTTPPSPSTDSIREMVQEVQDTTEKAIDAGFNAQYADNGADRSTSPPAAQLTSALKATGKAYTKDPNATMGDGVRAIQLNEKAKGVMAGLNFADKQNDKPLIKDTVDDSEQDL